MKTYPETAVLLNTTRRSYSVKQVLDNTSTLTVGELISYLSDLDPEAPILFSNDDGYTFGEIRGYSIDEVDIEEENF